jgi:hypothetical protein
MCKEWNRCCSGCSEHGGALFHGPAIADREQLRPEAELRRPLLPLVDQPLGKGILRLERVRASVRGDLCM